MSSITQKQYLSGQLRKRSLTEDCIASTGASHISQHIHKSSSRNILFRDCTNHRCEIHNIMYAASVHAHTHTHTHSLWKAILNKLTDTPQSQTNSTFSLGLTLTGTHATMKRAYNNWCVLSCTYIREQEGI